MVSTVQWLPTVCLRANAWAPLDLGYGVAIPHGRIKGHEVAPWPRCFRLQVNAIGFDAPDEKPVSLHDLLAGARGLYPKAPRNPCLKLPKCSATLGYARQAEKGLRGRLGVAPIDRQLGTPSQTV